MCISFFLLSLGRRINLEDGREKLILLLKSTTDFIDYNGKCEPRTHTYYLSEANNTIIHTLNDNQIFNGEFAIFEMIDNPHLVRYENILIALKRALSRPKYKALILFV